MAKLVMVGTCPNCKKEVTNRYPFEIGLCHCTNVPTEVKLELAIVPSPPIQRALRKASELSGVAVEVLAEALLKEVAEGVKRGIKIESRRMGVHSKLVH